MWKLIKKNMWTDMNPWFRLFFYTLLTIIVSLATLSLLGII